MDATVIDLALSVFPWAAFRKTKSNAVYRVIRRQQVNKKHELTSDQAIILSGIKEPDCPYP